MMTDSPPVTLRAVTTSGSAAFFRRLCGNNAFSLVEVVLALGIFAFAVLSIVGVLSVGLNSVSTSNNSFAIANITRSLRANYQSMAYSTAVPAASPSSSPSPVYFTGAGYRTDPTTPQNVNDPVFYTVVCTPTTTNTAPGSLINSQNAAVVAVKISYPYPSSAQTNTFSLLLAQ